MMQANYAERTHKLNIVSLIGDLDASYKTAAEKALNSIYGRVGVTWEVELTKFDNDSIKNEILKDGLSIAADDESCWKKETREMKAIRKLYQNSVQTIDKDAAYLFVVNHPEEDKFKGTEGDMPRSQSVGYIFKDNVTDASKFGRLVAHEIGHGVYKFQHTFDYGVEEKSTDNLMDYNNGDFLAHYQWRVMQDSVMFVWGLFQDDEDGMKVQELFEQEIARFINEVRCAIKKHTEDVNENELYIFFGWNEYSEKIEDVAKSLGISVNSKIANEKIYVNVSNSIISNGNGRWLGYKTVTLDINKIKIDKIRRSITIESAKNNQGSLFFSVDSNDAFNWLLTELGYNRHPLNRNYKNCDLNLDDIMVYSLCDLEKICIKDRIKLIKQIAENPEDIINRDNDTYQFLCSRLITTTPANDQEALYNFFVTNPKLVINCYDKFANEQKTKFITTLLMLWLDKCNDIHDSEKLFFFKKSVFGNLYAYAKFDNDTVRLYKKWYDYDAVDDHVKTEYQMILGGALFEPIYVGIDHRGGNINKQDIEKYINEVAVVPLPAICIKYIADNGNWEDVKATCGLIFDVVTSVSGFVGGMSSVLKMFKSKKFISGTFKFLFDGADFAQGSISTICGFVDKNCDDCGEFCKTWKEYEKYVSLGFVTKGIAEKYAEKLQNSYVNVSKYLEKKDVDFFEKECGFYTTQKINSALDNWKKSLDQFKDKELILKLENFQKENFQASKLLNSDLELGGQKANDIWALIKEDPNIVDKAYVNYVKNGPDHVYEVSKTDENVEKVMKNATSTFEDVLAKGQNFEKKVCREKLADKESGEYNKLKDLFKKDFQKELDEYTLFNDVQLFYKHNGIQDYFVADHIFVKFNERKEIVDFVIIEDKLNETTKLSRNQSEAFKCMNFTVKSNNKKSADNTAKLIKGSSISIKGDKTQIYKVFDSDNGKEIKGIKKFE